MAEARYCNPEFMAFELMQRSERRAHELAEKLVHCRRDAFTDEQLRDIAQCALEFAFLYTSTCLTPSDRRFAFVEDLLELGLPSEDGWRRSGMDVLAIEALTGTEFDTDRRAFVPMGRPDLQGRALGCFLQFRVCSDDVRGMALRQLIALMERCREHPGYDALGAACVSRWLRDRPGPARRAGRRCPIAGECRLRGLVEDAEMGLTPLSDCGLDERFCFESAGL